MRRRQKQVDTVSRDLTEKLGRTPTEAELAGEMGVTTERWRRIAIELRTTGPVSISPREDLDQTQEISSSPHPTCAPTTSASAASGVRLWNAPSTRAVSKSSVPVLRESDDHEADR